MLRHGLFVCALILGAIVDSGQLRAAIIASDSFEAYSTGATLNANNGGTGFSGAYIVGNSTATGNPSLATSVNVVAQSLSYTNGSVLVNGGSKAVRVTGVADSNELISRPFAAQTGTVYVSFLFNVSSTVESFLQFGLSDAATAEPKSSFGVQGSGANVDPLKFFVRSPNGSTTQTISALEPAANQTYFLVARISKAGASTTYNQVDLFVNPTSLSEATPSVTVTGANNSGASSFSNFILRTARTDANNTYTFDALTIGTTFADVVPTVIPEPSLLALLAVPVAGWFWRRQRAAA